MVQNPNQNQCNSCMNPIQPFNNYMMPGFPWQIPFYPQTEFNDAYNSQYGLVPQFFNSNNYVSPDMSDIIERIHKLDISIDNLTKNTCNCKTLKDTPHGNNGYYKDYFLNS